MHMSSHPQDYCHRFQGMPAYNSYGEPEPVGWKEGMVPSIDFTEPLRPQEKDKLTLLVGFNAIRVILRYLPGLDRGRYALIWQNIFSE